MNHVYVTTFIVTMLIKKYPVYFFPNKNWKLTAIYLWCVQIVLIPHACVVRQFFFQLTLRNDKLYKTLSNPTLTCFTCQEEKNKFPFSFVLLSFPILPILCLLLTQPKQKALSHIQLSPRQVKAERTLTLFLHIDQERFQKCRREE